MEFKSHAHRLAAEDLYRVLRQACDIQALAFPNAAWSERCTDKTVDSLHAKLLPQIDYYQSGRLTGECREIAKRAARKGWHLNKLELMKPSWRAPMPEGADEFLASTERTDANLLEMASHDRIQEAFAFLIESCGERPEAAAAFLLNECYGVPYLVIVRVVQRRLGVTSNAIALRAAASRIRKRHLQTMARWWADQEHVPPVRSARGVV